MVIRFVVVYRGLAGRFFRRGDLTFFIGMSDLADMSVHYAREKR
jgi:hypothetical protein